VSGRGLGRGNNKLMFGTSLRVLASVAAGCCAVLANRGIKKK